MILNQISILSISSFPLFSTLTSTSISSPGYHSSSFGPKPVLTFRLSIVTSNFPLLLTVQNELVAEKTIFIVLVEFESVASIATVLECAPTSRPSTSFESTFAVTIFVALTANENVVSDSVTVAVFPELSVIKTLGMLKLAVSLPVFFTVKFLAVLEASNDKVLGVKVKFAVAIATPANATNNITLKIIRLDILIFILL